MSFIFCKRCRSQAYAKNGPFDDIFECPECGDVDADGNVLLRSKEDVLLSREKDTQEVE